MAKKIIDNSNLGAWVSRVKEHVSAQIAEGVNVTDLGEVVLSQETGLSQVTVMSQKAVTDALNSVGHRLVEVEEVNIVLGHKIDATGNSVTDDKWCHTPFIPVRNGDTVTWMFGGASSSASSAGRLAIYNAERECLNANAYSPIETESGTSLRTLTINFPAAAWLRASVYDGFSQVYVRVERDGAKVAEWRPQADGYGAKLVGRNNDIVRTILRGVPLKGGHTYRVWLDNPDIDMSGVTVTGSGYDRFNIVCMSASGVSTSLVRVVVSQSGALNSFYEIQLPEDVAAISISMRATAGAELRLWAQDITNLLKEGIFKKVSGYVGALSMPGRGQVQQGPFTALWQPAR